MALGLICAPAHAVSTAVEECAVRMESDARGYRADIRGSFTQRFATQRYTTPEQNRVVIDRALELRDDCTNATMENAMMWKLNDQIFKNKDFVTALTNFHKSLFIDELSKRLPNKRPDLYSDFKSVRVSICEPMSAEDLNALEAAFIAANARFKNSSVLTQITRPEDVRDQWFFMGIGKTIELADRTAYYARTNGGANHVRRFDDPDVRQWFDRQFNRARDLHSEILRAIGWAELPFEVYAASRKASSIAKIQDTLKNTVPGMVVDEATATKMLELVGIVNVFTPSLLIEKKEDIGIEDAPFGAIALDFLGLGAENLAATARAIFAATNVEDAFRLARAGEREVTETFNARKERVRAEVSDFFNGQVRVQFSGDDGVIVPLVEFWLREQLQLLQRISRHFPRPFLRMSVINPAGVGPASSELITHAETVEKAIRPMLLRDLGLDVVNDIQIDVYIPDADPRGRQAYLVLNLKRELTPAQKAIVRNDFHAAVLVLQDSVRALGQNTIYEAVEVFAIRP